MEERQVKAWNRLCLNITIRCTLQWSQVWNCKICPQPFQHQGPVSWKTYFHRWGGRWFGDESRALYLSCTLLLLHKLQLRSPSMRSQRLGTPEIGQLTLAYLHLHNYQVAFVDINDHLGIVSPITQKSPIPAGFLLPAPPISFMVKATEHSFAPGSFQRIALL